VTARAEGAPILACPHDKGKRLVAHLDKSFTSYETFLSGADGIWSVDLGALNSSGVSGTGLVAMNTEDDGTRYINVSLFASGLTPDEMHPQHIHGTFDASGTTTDATTPDLGDDADNDGFIEVLEGVADYGDVLVSLVENGGAPVANAKGEVAYIQNFDIDLPENLLSPVTGTQYDADDLMPLVFREIVLHGQNVMAGVGAGTDGEIDGTQDGYVPILPVAAGEIEETDLDTALAILAEQRAEARDIVRLGDEDDVVDTGVGDDRVWSGQGDDQVMGGGDDDVLWGNLGNDFLFGGSGNDWITGGQGADEIRGDAGDDWIHGSTGIDMLRGGEGADTFVFGAVAGRDVIFDFEVGVDMLHFVEGAGERTMVQDGRDVVIDYGDGNSLVLTGTDVDDLFGMI
jgi:Ca2+-binding RTX toxin-like protein